MFPDNRGGNVVMKKGKILAVALVVVILSSLSAFADDTKIGVLAKAGMTEEEFTASVAKVWKWSVIDELHKNGANIYYFYDSVNSMLLALMRGDIQEIELPRTIAEYVIATNPGHKISCVLGTTEADFVFGFLRDDKGAELQRKFNGAIRTLKKDGTLEALQKEYITNPKYDSLKPAEFAKFDGAETIKVAITGDVPPIDFIAPDGQAVGFNVALLSEIGKILGANIELVEVDAIARTPSLTSGRVDAVFWYQVVVGAEIQHDIPEEVIVSESYYDWDTFVHIRKADASDTEDEEE